MYQFPNSIIDIQFFKDRVCKENLWSLEYCEEVIEEYKKYLYLATLQNVAPSYEIDMVWHNHILFTKDYEKTCNQLGKFIHHTPTEPTIETPPIDNYKSTLNLYREIFFSEPPHHIWTQWKPTHYALIDLKTHWVFRYGDTLNLFKTLIHFYYEKIIQLFKKIVFQK